MTGHGEWSRGTELAFCFDNSGNGQGVLGRTCML